MKIKELALLFENDLRSLYGEEEAKALFLIALEHFAKLNRAAYLSKKEEELAPAVLEEIESVLNQLKMHRPIQYIIGETIFYGLTFKVNGSVLIPRPETEELVDWVIEKVNSLQLQRFGAQSEIVHILDIGTGSGCIAISLKKNLKNVAVAALDISSEALAAAAQNALINEVEITFITQDILLNQVSTSDDKYSVIVSNPPYITQTEKEAMHENVLANEPHLALFVSNERPLIFYEEIADYALNNLKKEGLLFFEINEHLGKETIEMLLAKGFINTQLKKDMQGKDRMICCERSSFGI